MKTQQIYSKNATFQKFEVLLTNRNKRHKYGEFIVEGVRNINEAIRNEWEIASFIYLQNSELSQWAKRILHDIKTDINYELTGTLMTEISGKDDTSELLALIKMKDNVNKLIELSSNPIIALFDRPSNKGNLGTMLRSCDAFGVELLIITGHSVDIYDPDVIASTTGSFFSVPFIKLTDNNEIDNYINALKQKYPAMKVIGTTEDKKTAIYDIDMTTPILFLLGNEKSGLSYHYLEISDELATIPMSEDSSASSFNVSCAATVLFYEAIRQRNR